MKNKLLFILLLSGAIADAQNNAAKWIQGSVTDPEKSISLSKATVHAIVSNTTVVTNQQGSFKIRISHFPDTLQITSTGYDPKKLVVEDTGSLVIYLVPKITELTGVTVNTGYQMVKPNEINGSVFVVDNKTLNQQSGTNILDRLNGVVPGLTFITGKNNSNGNPQNTTGIVINGHSTINGPLDPLIVVDNFPFEGDINNLNPNDVESVSVLKDAAATSIWGPRAGNGVIVITTKRGKFNQKLSVSLNNTLILKERPDLYKIPQISVSDYLNIEQWLFNKGYYNSQVSNNSRPALTDAVEVLIQRKNGSISSADSLQMMKALGARDTRSEYNRLIGRNALIQQHALNISGGGNNYAWIIAGNYEQIHNNQNIVDNGSKKINVRIDNVYKPVKNLLVKLGVYYTSSDISQTIDDYSFTAIRMNQTKYVPYLKFADVNGVPLPVTKNIRKPFIDTAGAGLLMDWNYYPADDYKHARRTVNLEQILANVSVNYKLTSYLDADLIYQYSKQRSETTALSDTLSYYTRNLYNLLFQRTTNTSPVPRGAIVDLANATLTSGSARGQLNFRKSWGQHAVTSIAGAEIRQTTSSGTGSRLYGYNADPLYYTSNVDVTGLYSNFITGNSTSVPASISALSKNINRFVALYANFSYTYRKKYSISGSARKDGANIFGLKTNDKWKPLWSAGAGWRLSDEPFFKRGKISDLRIRASYGFSGNVDLSRTALPVASYGNPGSITQPFPFAYITTLNNPELRWERVGQVNLGVDVTAFDNRITGNIDVYRKKGTDLYAQTPYDYTAWGFTNMITRNVAGMEGRGVTLSLLTTNIRRQVNWTTNWIFNYASEKTTAYYTPISQIGASLLGGGSTITPVVGKPLYAIAAFKWGGLNNQGDPQGYLNGALSTDYLGIINEANIKGLEGTTVRYIGPTTPTLFGNLINEFSWRGLSLSFNIAYKGGYYFRKNSLSYSSLFLSGAGNPEFAQRWQKPGDEVRTNVPSLVYTDYPQFENRNNFYQLSEVNVLKADHLRLQYLNIDYDFLIGKQALFNRMSLYANVANLGIIW
ncbi:MAG: SusC/RagA family TonB-linked outer membrane protein, partial [Niabella sp.]|nr:SusC/RagA family TonB-linked outer membrane protein [Niabella sp.]